MASSFLKKFSGGNTVAQVVTDELDGRILGGLIKAIPAVVGVMTVANHTKGAPSVSRAFAVAAFLVATYAAGSFVQAYSTMAPVRAGTPPVKQTRRESVRAFGRRFRAFLNPLHF